eukprot:sb/3470899/
MSLSRGPTVYNFNYDVTPNTMALRGIFIISAAPTKEVSLADTMADSREIALNVNPLVTGIIVDLVVENELVVDIIVVVGDGVVVLGVWVTGEVVLEVVDGVVVLGLVVDGVVVLEVVDGVVVLEVVDGVVVLGLVVDGVVVLEVVDGVVVLGLVVDGVCVTVVGWEISEVTSGHCSDIFQLRVRGRELLVTMVTT